jgi:hypothetical protein
VIRSVRPERLLKSLALLLALAPACSRSSAVPQGTSTPPSVPRAAVSARGVARGYGIAAPETISTSPSLESDRQPTVDYPSLGVARDSIGSIVRRALSPAGPNVRVTRSPARFQYRYAADSASGWEFRIAVTDTSECPDARVESALQAAGWAPASGYAADGDDGTVMGFVTKRFLCVVEGRWEGGDPTDSTYVPRPGCELTVTCVPRRKDDVPKW